MSAILNTQRFYLTMCSVLFWPGFKILSTVLDVIQKLSSLSAIFLRKANKFFFKSYFLYAYHWHIQPKIVLIEITRSVSIGTRVLRFTIIIDANHRRTFFN